MTQEWLFPRPDLDGGIVGLAELPPAPEIGGRRSAGAISDVALMLAEWNIFTEVPLANSLALA